MAVIQYVGGGPVPIPSQVLGPRGPKGWTPIFVGVPNGARKVLLLADWTGGANPKPATGYIGEEGLVADIADAVDFAGRGLLSVEQDVNANMVINYNDNTSDIIPAYFAPMLAAAAEVDADAQAVEISRQAIVGIQADVVAKQGQINDTKLAADAARDLALQHKTGSETAATQSAASAASANALVTGVSTSRPSVRPSLLLDFANSDLLDPRITYTRNDSAKTYFDNKGVLRVAGPNQWPREFDPVTGKCVGRSVWEARTNNIRNSTMAGAVLGVPGLGGSLPTNWSQGVVAGITVEVVAKGQESGMDYIDIRYSGTTSAAGSISLYPDSTSGTGAWVVGDSAVWSLYAKLISGSVAVSNNYSMSMDEKDSASVYLGTTTGISIKAMTSSLTRFVNIAPLTRSTVAKVTPAISMGLNSGVTIDFTVRYAALQLEKGAFATPFIPTTTVAVTRQADVAQITGTAFTDWYRQDEGAVYVEGTNGAPGVSSGATMLHINTGGSPNQSIYVGQRLETTQRISVATNPNTSTITWQLQRSGVPTVGATARFSVAYKANDIAGSYNGEAVLTDTDATIPPADRIIIGAVSTGGSQIWNGPIACIAYWPKRISNTELQAITGSGLLAGKNPNQLPTAGDLGTAAFTSVRALLESRNRQEFQSEGTGVSRTVTIRRPYDFTFALVESTGVTVTAQPSASCLANTSYSLTFNASAGTFLTYSITPIFS